MSRVSVCALALLVAACAAGAAPPSGFIETVNSLVASGRVAPEVAQEVIAAYQEAFAAPAWWERVLEGPVGSLLSLVVAILWIRFAPAQLGGRGIPEQTRQRRGRISGTPT